MASATALGVAVLGAMAEPVPSSHAQSRRDATAPATPTAVPLPRPRPSEAGPRSPDRTAPASPLPSTADPSEASLACAARLAAVAEVQALPPAAGPGECGAEDLVEVKAIRSGGAAPIAIVPAARLRCAMAQQLAEWVREDIEPAATDLAAPLHSVVNDASFECRSRNRVAGAKLSEHGKANAIDVRGFRLTNGSFVELTDVAVAKAMRERIKTSACARFTTVLGPGSDGFHEKHIHLDLAERRGGYRICQWNVLEPADLLPPVPPERPAAAPARPGESGPAATPGQVKPAR